MAEHKVLYGASITVNAGAPGAGTLLLGIEETVQEITPEQARAIAADLTAHADTLDRHPTSLTEALDQYDRETETILRRMQEHQADLDRAAVSQPGLVPKFCWCPPMDDCFNPDQHETTCMLREWLDVWKRTVETPTVLFPFRGKPTIQRGPFGVCYRASWGWVHVKPGCRCPH